VTFPTIPTAPTQVAGLNQLNTTATLTGPNLNTLTKAAGDLLVAIAGEYQSNAGTDAAYTGWAGGGLTWTEIQDSTGTAVNRLGVAIARVVTGSETGTVTVTRSGTLVGDASMIVLVIPGAHATTDPEATVMATAANATPGAAPATLTPSWGAEDTLWIGVNGSGMTSATSTWTGTTGAPTNYTGYFDTAAADTSTVGDFDMAVAFRQLNAASETMAGFAVDATLNRTSALLIAVRPAPANLTATPADPVGITDSATASLVPGIADSPGLSLSSFGTFTGVGPADTINYVRVSITHHVAATGNAPTYELWDGTTAQIGTTQTGTTGTTDHTDTHDFTGVTYSQLATLRVRVYGHAPTTIAESVDSVSLTVNYTAVAGQTKTPADPVGITDSATEVQTYDRQPTDPIGITDSAGEVQAYDRQPADNVGITDSLTATLEKISADPVGITDSLATVATFDRQPADAVGITDALSVSQSGGGSTSVNDPVGLTDALTVAQARTASITDPVGITDSATDSQDRPASPADPVGITDAIAQVWDRATAIADPVGITDPGQTLDRADQLDDPVGITDSAGKSQSGAGTANISDPVGITDAAAEIQAYDRQLADPVGLTDALTVLWTRVATVDDLLGITDSASKSQAGGSSSNVNDPEAITDAAAWTAARDRQPSDPVGITDTVVAVLDRVILLADPVGITDVVTKQATTLGDGVPVKNPGTVLTIPIPGITLTIPDTDTTLTLPATRTELT
jgi:hypothetical protein